MILILPDKLVFLKRKKAAVSFYGFTAALK